MGNFIKEFWLELSATIIVAVLVSFMSYYFGLVTKFRQNWRMFNLIRQHILRTYNGWDECENEIIDQLGRSVYVDILNMKGRRLSKSPPYRDTLQSRVHRNKRTRILFQHPASLYVNEDVSKEFGWDTLEEYRDDLIHSIKRFMRATAKVRNDDYQIRLYDSKPVLKLFLFDSQIFLSIYTGKKADQYGGKGPTVWCLNRKIGQLGLSFIIERYFESVWEQSVQPSDISELD